MMSKLKFKRNVANRKTLTVSFIFKINSAVDNKSKRGGFLEEKSFSMQEKEKIIEVLLSQERVLTLLYDKTFPPRANNQVHDEEMFGAGVGVEK